MVEKTATVETVETTQETYLECDACGKEVEDNIRYVPAERDDIWMSTNQIASMADAAVIDLCKDCRGAEQILNEDRISGYMRDNLEQRDQFAIAVGVLLGLFIGPMLYLSVDTAWIFAFLLVGVYAMMKKPDW